MIFYASGEGETNGQPEDLLGPGANVMLTFWLSHTRKKGIQPRFKKLYKLRKQQKRKKQ